MKDSTPDEKLTLCGHCHKMTRGIPTCGECGGWREDNTSDELKDKWIKGVKCPACNVESLFVGSGGYITCSRLDCPNPDYAEAFTQKLNEAYDKGWNDHSEKPELDFETVKKREAFRLQSTQNGGE